MTSLRKFWKRPPLREFLLPLAVALSLFSCCKPEGKEPAKEPPPREAKAIGELNLDLQYFEALRLYEEGRVEEALPRLESIAREEENYPYLGDVYDLLADCYGALDMPAQEHHSLLRALLLYRKGGKTRRYASPQEAIESIENYLPLLRKQIEAKGGEG